MRLTKEQEVRAANELLAMLASDKQSGGMGLRTSEMQGTPAFHGSNTLACGRFPACSARAAKRRPSSAAPGRTHTTCGL